MFKYVKYLLVLLAFCLLLQNCKHDEPVKKDVYSITAFFYGSKDRELMFVSVATPEQALIEYLNKKSVMTSQGPNGPWSFKNIPIDAANRFLQKDSNDQQFVTDTFQLKCKILPDDQLPPRVHYGFGPQYAQLEIVEIKPYK